MSDIPAGLRADHMRHRMIDKAICGNVGSLYVGGITTTNIVTGYSGTVPSTTVVHEPVELVPGATPGLPLVSNGTATLPSYQVLGANAISDGAITKAKLGNGAVASADNNKKILKIEPKSGDNKVLVIRYYNAQ